MVTQYRCFRRHAFRIAENDHGGPERIRGICCAGNSEVNEFPESGVGNSFIENLDEKIAKPNIRLESAAVDLRVETGAWRRQSEKYRARA